MPAPRLHLTPVASQQPPSTAAALGFPACDFRPAFFRYGKCGKGFAGCRGRTVRHRDRAALRDRIPCATRGRTLRSASDRDEKLHDATAASAFDPIAHGPYSTHPAMP